ncbi:YncE family protein [Mycobacterium fragae]|uniref:YncE family protein n=1 Tax=Mycobacterium fragae TaxID=1260918 RepID=UPI00111C713E|nr:YncE family protein [Mycobacterium fragae]MCV7399630.1 YncE family protein [Mycobacterium fragae]
MSDVSYVNGVGAATGDFSVVAEIAVGQGAISAIAISSDGGRLMATHYQNDRVSVIASGDRPQVRSVLEAGEPFAVALAHTRRGYISTTSTAYDSIVALDLNTDRVEAVYPVAHAVTDLAVSPNGRHLYASRNAVNGADVAVLDTKTGREDAIAIAAAPGTTTECVRVSPDGNRLYVGINGPSMAELLVIDAHQKQVLSTIQISSPIRDVAVSPDGATAYVASCAADFSAVLDVVDTRTGMVASTHKVGEITGCLTQLALSRDGERGYLVSDESVMVLDTLTANVIASVAVGSQPSCVVESPDGSRLYISDYAGSVTVLAITSYDEPTAPHHWALPDLPALESAMT